jgi:hypothetical protein
MRGSRAIPSPRDEDEAMWLPNFRSRTLRIAGMAVAGLAVVGGLGVGWLGRRSAPPVAPPVVVEAAASPAGTEVGGETAPSPSGTLVDPRASVPATPTVLSAFEARDDMCVWMRLDPLQGQRRDVAAFRATCERPQVVWNRDASRAVVWTQRHDGSEAALWEVSLADGSVHALARPDPVWGPLVEVGYDTDHGLRAFTSQRSPAGGARALRSVGRVYLVPDDGSDWCVVHALEWTGQAWQQRVQRFLACDGGDASAVDTLREPRDPLGPVHRTTTLPVDDTASTRFLTRSGVSAPAGWIQVGAVAIDGDEPPGGAPPLFSPLASDHSGRPLRRLVAVVNKAPQVAEDVAGETPTEVAEVTRRGSWALIAREGGHEPALLDLESLGYAWVGPELRGTAFWPSGPRAPLADDAQAHDDGTRDDRPIPPEHGGHP